MEMGGRFEQYQYEWNEAGAPILEDVWTFGLRYSYRQTVDVKTNYVIRRTEDPSNPHLDDNALLVRVQLVL
jgi:hypothetical protein